MTAVFVSPAAEADLGAVTDYYLAEAGVEVAIAFLTAWDHCVGHISEFPASGSPRLAATVGIAGLRVWQVKGFPHLVVYTETARGVTVIRVLHSARDIPAHLQE